ncbi:hypothetical protein B0H13DRAFT_2301261 [Mycena leptocephala]|nr:hypothetical protein B0H13DRAFT_2301261 [Mycena leptocephala]
MDAFSVPRHRCRVRCFGSARGVVPTPHRLWVASPRLSPCFYALYSCRANAAQICAAQHILGNGVQVFNLVGSWYTLTQGFCSTSLHWLAAAELAGSQRTSAVGRRIDAVRAEPSDGIEAVGPRSPPACAPSQQGSGAGCTERELQPPKSARCVACRVLGAAHTIPIDGDVARNPAVPTLRSRPSYTYHQSRLLASAVQMTSV